MRSQVARSRSLSSPLRLQKLAALGALCLTLILQASCAQFFSLLGDPTAIGVEIFNNSDFEVLPDIRFDADERIAASAAAESLSIGTLLPGEFVQFDFDCERLGLIFSDETELRFGGSFIGVADASSAARFGTEFQCGDDLVIEFRGSPAAGVIEILTFRNGVQVLP